MQPCCHQARGPDTLSTLEYSNLYSFFTHGISLSFVFDHNREGDKGGFLSGQLAVTVYDPGGDGDPFALATSTKRRTKPQLTKSLTFTSAHAVSTLSEQVAAPSRKNDSSLRELFRVNVTQIDRPRNDVPATQLPPKKIPQGVRETKQADMQVFTDSSRTDNRG